MKDGKISIVVQAKDEDDYIDEWLEYNFKLGVDDIYILQHCGWRYSGKFKNDQRLHLIEISERIAQFKAIFNEVLKIRELTDWAILIDVDEFIVLKNGMNNIKDFLKLYDDFIGVQFNWRLFGSSGLTEGEDKSVLKRFVRCSKNLHPWAKLALNLRKLPEDCRLLDVHTLVHENGNIAEDIVNVSKKHFQTSPKRNDEDLDEELSIAYIAHFKSKTYTEFIRRTDSSLGYFHYAENDFELQWLYSEYYKINKNEVEDKSALRFMETGSF